MNKAAAIAVISFAVCGSALAQTTGVSHPDEVIVVNPETGESTSNYTASPVQPPPAPVLHPASERPLPSTHVSDAQPGLPSSKPLLASSNPDIDAGIVTRVEGPSDTLPEGTLLKMRLHQELSTLETRPGAIFDGELTEDVERDGRVMLPAGSILSGRVTEVHGGKRISGSAMIHLMPMAITLPDGTRLPIHALVIDTNLYKSIKVDREGTIIRRDHPKETLAIVGATAGTGAVAGGMLAGPPGALVGAGVGAGVSTVVWLKQDRQTELPVDTKIVFSLTSPLFVGNGIGPIRESMR